MLLCFNFDAALQLSMYPVADQTPEEGDNSTQKGEKGTPERSKFDPQ